MKLQIGENIRVYRKKKDLTQEEFAEMLGVTYQSVSRWENGNTYPDIELLPVIANILKITMDELMGMSDIEKENRATEAYDSLRRECIKKDYDSDKIVALLKDIRLNFLDSESSWRPWCEGNDRAFRDPKILPEARLLAEAYLERHPMQPHVIKTMAEIEDEEHLEHFLGKYTTPFDCSARALLLNRYLRRGDAEKFEPERRYQLHHAFSTLLCPRYLIKWGESTEHKQAVDKFMETMLSLIRCDAEDDRPDMWIDDRIELGLKSAVRSISLGNQDAALSKIEGVVKLLEDTMMITDEVVLPTSCRFLDGMEWRAEEDWMNRDNNPDSPKERMIYVSTQMNGMCTCYCLFPSNYYDMLKDSSFDPVRDEAEFIKLCDRVKSLIVTKDA